MADQLLTGQAVRGLFLMIGDFQQNAFPLTKLYAGHLKDKNYNLHIVNESRPDIFPATETGVGWPRLSERFPQSTVVVLHDFELLLALANADFGEVVKDMLKLLARENVKQVVCVLNRDLSNDAQLKKLEYICTQRLDILSREGDTFTVETLWKKPSGKAIVQKEEIKISDGVLVKCSVVKETSPLEEVTNRTASSSSPDPLAGLTFNVRISPQEQKDKDQLVLPYTQTGEISYTLDREDDFDEEDDPDDDLNI